MPKHPSCHHVSYRLTCADFDELWEYAGGRCQICRIAPENVPSGKLEIDHDGKYGYWAVRGLVCGKCNTLLSFVDRGLKYDARAFQYRYEAWFVRVIRDRHKAAIAASAEAL